MSREKLLKHCTIISGFAFKSADLKSEEGVPVIKIGNISNGGNVIIDDETQTVPVEFLSLAEKYHIKKGDVLISLTGSHMNQPNSMVGRSCRSYNDQVYLLNQRAGKAIINESNTDKAYLYYLFCTQAIKGDIVNRAYGAANQVNVSPTDIMNIKWDFPSLEKQRNIGESLERYDVIIQKNYQRITLLEKLIGEIYKEWFIRFRYPGSEEFGMQDGIPIGWEYKRVDECIRFERGISYSSEEIDTETGVNLINLKNIEAYGGFRRDGTKKYEGRYRDSQIVYKGDLIMGVTDMTQDRRTVGAVALIPQLEGVSVISADLVKIISKYDNSFLYCMFKFGNYSKYFSQFANGANVLHLKPNTLASRKMLIPSSNIIDMFAEIITPIISNIDSLNMATDNLIYQRNRLLPRLMREY